MLLHEPRCGCSIELERDPERAAELSQPLRPDFPAPCAEGSLWQRDQIVAVHDRLSAKTVLGADRHLGRKSPNRARDAGDGQVGEHGNRAIAGDDDRRPPADPRELDLVDVTTIQSGSPPSAASQAAKAASPAIPIHSSCGNFS